MPSSWIVQEPPPATSSCSSPCSSWVARVSLKRQNHSLLFIPNYYPVLSDILLDGVQALSTSASPSLSTKPCSGSRWSQITEGVFFTLWNCRQQLHGISALSAFKQLRSEVFTSNIYLMNFFMLYFRGFLTCTGASFRPCYKSQHQRRWCLGHMSNIGGSC